MRHPDGPHHGGSPPTAGEERARLVAEVVRYLRDWEGVLNRGLDAARPQIGELQQRASFLEPHARGVGFGGLGHHIAECARLVQLGADAPSLRAQLATTSELAWQARHELSPAEQAHVDRLAAAPRHAAAAAPAPAAAGDPRPPRMVTVMRPPQTGGGPAASPGFQAPSLLASGAGQAAPVGPPPPISGPAPPPPLGPSVIGRSPLAPAGPAQPHPAGAGPGAAGPLPAPGPAAAGLPPLGPAAAGSLPPLGPAPAGSLPPLGPGAAGSLPPLGPGAAGSLPPLGPAAAGSLPPLGPAPAGSLPPLGPGAAGSLPPLGPGAAGSLPPLGPAGASPPAIQGAPAPSAAAGPASLQPPPPLFGPAAGSAGPPAIGPAQAPPPPAAPGGAPNFLVRTMFRLRGVGGAGKSVPPPAPPAAGGTPSLLGLRSLSSSGDGPAPPPLVHDASGLPPLGAPGAGRSQSGSAKDMQQLFSRMGRDSTGSRKRASARAKPRKSGPHGRARSHGPSGWWLLLAAAMGLGVLGLVAFLTLSGGKTPTVTAPGPASSKAAATPTAQSSVDTSSLPDVPREKLLADDERFKVLLAQVHGRGGKESPELRALLNEQAALASKALTKKCDEQSGQCAAWQATKELLVGEKLGRPIKKRVPRPADQRASRWLAGLKLPNIPVEDDPRVQKVFEYYSQSQVGRETFQSMLFRCGAYRDLIMSTLIRYELPTDLLALVFAESGCEPQAKSPVGAAGLWQFMPDTARAYRLMVKDGVVDERISPFKSTEAGVRFLADLYQKLGSWDLVFASYNMGPFGLIARIERAGGDVGFWDLVDADLLPDETANYAPTIQALALILANLQTLKFAGIQMRAPQLTADLDVPGGTSLSLVARAAATSTGFIRTLNLDIVGHEVPNLPSGRFIVQVPKDSVWQARETLQELLKSGDRSDLCVPPTFDWGKQRFTQEMAAACRKSLGSTAGKPAATP